MKERLNVGIIFGGRSGEHEISIISAREVIEALDPSQYHVIPIYISQEGQWYLSEIPTEQYQLSQLQPTMLLPEPNKNEMLIPDDRGHIIKESESLRVKLDVLFPLLHGPNGEDGTVQGLFELANVPYVGAGVLGSAVGMDKAIMKSLFSAAGLPIVPYQVVMRHRWEEDQKTIQTECEKHLTYPMFVKPANLGSSIGIHKIKTSDDFIPLVNDSMQYDRKVVIEQGIDARDIEMAVLGYHTLKVSVPGEIITSHEYYSYEAKYADETVGLEIPANLPNDIVKTMQDYAIKAFEVIDCAGMARVDFLVDRKNHTVFVSEVNTIPGFTKISMYPKLFEASGLPYSKLLDELIKLAIERYQDKKKNKTDYQGAITF